MSWKSALGQRQLVAYSVYYTSWELPTMSLRSQISFPASTEPLPLRSPSCGWQLSCGERLGSGSLRRVWVTEEQTSSAFHLKGSREGCCAPWKHLLASAGGIASTDGLLRASWGAGDEGSLQLHEVCPPVRAISVLPTTRSVLYAASEMHEGTASQQ